MSQPLVSRSPDLQKLVSEGYELAVVADHLVVSHVPFLNAAGTVEYGQLISELIDDGGQAGRPDPHTVYFTGIPHNNDGGRLTNIIASEGPTEVVPGFIAQSYLSTKPAVGYYSDYHAKISQYVKAISGWAATVDATATAKTGRPMVLDAGDSVFEYLDSASSRAGITALSNRLTSPVAIVGLGGTGSYVLDLVSKTHATDIHLWDGDVFSAHNAFRAPGAISAATLNTRPLKVNYFRDLYSSMRRGIVAHPEYVDDSNVGQLLAMSFVFITMDTGPAKKLIIDTLVLNRVPFIDTGMGIKKQRDALGGIIRVTTGVPDHTDHLTRRISFANEQDDDYDRNIQVADLNALNAVLAVIKWKKIMGVYLDLGNELHTTFTLSDSTLLNSEVIGDHASADSE